MDKDQKLLVTQAICTRFVNAGGTLIKSDFEVEVTALIGALKLINDEVIVDGKKEFGTLGPPSQYFKKGELEASQPGL